MAGEHGLDVDVVVGGSRALVRVSGELDHATVPVLRSALAPLGREPGDVVVVDVGGLTFADASALGALVAVHTRITGAGGRLLVRNPSPLLERMLVITRVAEVLVVEKDEADRAS